MEKTIDTRLGMSPTQVKAFNQWLREVYDDKLARRSSALRDNPYSNAYPYELKIEAHEISDIRELFRKTLRQERRALDENFDGALAPQPLAEFLAVLRERHRRARERYAATERRELRDDINSEIFSQRQVYTYLVEMLGTTQEFPES